MSWPAGGAPSGAGHTLTRTLSDAQCWVPPCLAWRPPSSSSLSFLPWLKVTPHLTNHGGTFFSPTMALLGSDRGSPAHVQGRPPSSWPAVLLPPGTMGGLGRAGRVRKQVALTAGGSNEGPEWSRCLLLVGAGHRAEEAETVCSRDSGSQRGHRGRAGLLLDTTAPAGLLGPQGCAQSSPG